MALVAITGGCGYVGSHVAKAFKEKGFETLVVDRNAAKNPHTHKYVDILVEDNFFSRAFFDALDWHRPCLLYTSPSPRDREKSRMPSSA